MVSVCKITKKKSNDLKFCHKKCRKRVFSKKITNFCSFFVENWDYLNIFCNFALEMEKCIQIHGQLMKFSVPRVMAIVNLSRDSFYSSCDVSCEEKFLLQVESMLNAGADILDVGACSTRPTSTPISLHAEWQSMELGLKIIRHHWSNVIISVDTFRPEVAEQAILNGADMINDVYGGDADMKMWDVIAKYRVPYVLTHAQKISDTCYYDATISQVLYSLQQKLDALRCRQINDVMIDPGFGFEKTLDQNYAILRQLNVLECLHAPILAGVSRKSMFYKPLNTTPDQVLSATIAAQMIALEQGANILRVHDVPAAKQAIAVYQLTYKDIL